MRWSSRLPKEPNSYVTLQGDLIDNGTRNSVTNIFKATMPPSQQKKREMAKALEPIRDKDIVCLPGNRSVGSGKDADDDPMYDIAAKLDLEDRYREDMAFIRIAGRNHTRSRAMASHTVTCWHVCMERAGRVAGFINRADRFCSRWTAWMCSYTDTHTALIHCVGQSWLVDVQNKRVTREANADDVRGCMAWDTLGILLKNFCNTCCRGGGEQVSFERYKIQV